MENVPTDIFFLAFDHSIIYLFCLLQNNLNDKNIYLKYLKKKKNFNYFYKEVQNLVKRCVTITKNDRENIFDYRCHALKSLLF